MSDEFSLFSDAADRNKDVILEALSSLFGESCSVLEIGSGSGQHAVCFARAMKNWQWQPMDREPYFESLCDNVARLGPENLAEPKYLDLEQIPVDLHAEAIFSANVVHIMPAALIENLFAFADSVLPVGSSLVLYGPYKYDGEFTTPSNAKFDIWLKEQQAHSGIRDIEVMIDAGQKVGFSLVEDRNMPANNQLLVFNKSS